MCLKGKEPSWLIALLQHERQLELRHLECDTKGAINDLALVRDASTKEPCDMNSCFTKNIADTTCPGAESPCPVFSTFISTGTGNQGCLRPRSHVKL